MKKNITRIALLFIIILMALSAGCRSNGNVRTVSAQPPQDPIIGVVKIQSIIPFTKDNMIAANIKNECRIGEQLSEFIATYTKDKNVEVERVPAVASTDAGQVLMIEITNAVSEGNAFIGHRKFTQIKGTLYKDGVQVSSFAGGRNSMGGAFAGFKGSCSVLGRTVDALGADISRWFMNPVKNGRLGDI